MPVAGSATSEDPPADEPAGSGRLGARTAFAFVAFFVGFVVAACSPGGSGTIVDIERVKEAGSTRTVTADGNLQALQQIPVAPEVGGSVSTVLVSNGQQVEAGTLLFTIDDAALQEQLSAVESASSGGGGGGGDSAADELEAPDFTELTKTLDTLMKASTEQLDQLKALDPTNPALQASIAQQQINLGFERALFQILVQTIATGDYAQAAGLAAFGSGLASLGGGGGSTAQADAQAAELRRQIQASSVDAPISGVVSLVEAAGAAGLANTTLAAATASSPGQVQPGSIVQPGQTVMTIYDLNGVQVEALVDEADIPQVTTGQAAEVRIDAYPGTVIDGKVAEVAVSPTVTEAGGVGYTVLVDVPAEKISGWRPGMTATVEVAVAQATQGIQLPASAIVSRSDTDYVFVVEGDTARLTEVDTAPGSEGFVIVTDGLRAGDAVVTSGASDLEDGEQVKQDDT